MTWMTHLKFFVILLAISACITQNHLLRRDYIIIQDGDYLYLGPNQKVFQHYLKAGIYAFSVNFDLHWGQVGSPWGWGSRSHLYNTIYTDILHHSCNVLIFYMDTLDNCKVVVKLLIILLL